MVLYIFILLWGKKIKFDFFGLEIEGNLALKLRVGSKYKQIWL